jgi:DNA-binding MarR family transcriptional regulator
MTIRDRVFAYIKDNPYCQGGDIATALKLDPSSISTATRELKKARLVDFTESERSGKGRRVTWFERGLPPVKMMDDERYAKFIAMMEEGRTGLEMKHELRCSSDKLRQWAQRARHEGVEVKEPPTVPSKRSQTDDIAGGAYAKAGGTYARGSRWSIGHLIG